MRYVLTILAILALGAWGLSDHYAQINRVRLWEEVVEKGPLMQKAMAQFKEHKGHYPESLAELVHDHIDAIPILERGTRKWEYFKDDKTFALYGHRRDTIREEAMPIRTAILKYKRENGDFPESLDQLVPQYIDSIPTPSDRKMKWIYKKVDERYFIRVRESYSVGYEGPHLDRDRIWYDN